MEKIRKKILEQRGKVLKFDAFVKLNERLDVEITPDEITVSPSQDEVLNAVGSLIEQVSGWDIEVFKRYVAEQFGIKKASHKDIIQWIIMESNKYCQAEVHLKGEEYVKKNKREKLPILLINFDHAMIVEKIYRRLRGLEDDDKPTPTFIKKMVDIFNECVPCNSGEEEEEEE